MTRVPGNKLSGDVLRAYCAGIIDGEAYVGAIRRSPSRAHRQVSPTYSVRVSIAMADEGPVRTVAMLAGAEDRVYRRDRKAKPHHSLMFVLDLESARAVYLLRQVMPFLIAKKAQAKLACQLHELKQRSRNAQTNVSSVSRFVGGPQIGKSYRNFSLSEDHLRRCDNLYIAMRRRVVTNNGVVTCPR